MIKDLLSACDPRPEVLDGELADAQFAASLEDVVTGTAAPDYGDPTQFFATTYPSAGLRSLLDQALGRLGGGNKQAAPMIRLETSYGGGKTHNLIALYHAAKGGLNALQAAEFMDPAYVPAQPIDRIAVAVGTSMSAISFETRDGIAPKTLWGAVALQLGGKSAYDEIAAEDQAMTAPDARQWKAIFGDQPNLILLDEMARYLAVAEGVTVGGTTLGRQVVAFLMSLFEAASTSPRTVVVLTLSTQQDAFSDSAERVSQLFAEARSVTSRSELSISAASEADLPAILARRLFRSTDRENGKAVAIEYGDALRKAHERGAAISDYYLSPAFVAAVEQSYPFHPALIRTLDAKLSTIPNFQRTRGALRLLADVIRGVWTSQASGARLIQLDSVDLGNPSIAQELTSRLDRAAFQSVIRADIVSGVEGTPAHAQHLDVTYNQAHPRYTVRLATAIFLGSLTAGVSGTPLGELLGSVLTPADEPSVMETSLKRLMEEGWYVDLGARGYRFQTEASLNKLVADAVTNVAVGTAKAAAAERLQTFFKPAGFTPLFTWTGAQAPDRARPPQLVVFHFDDLAVSLGDSAPAKVRAIYEKTPSGGLRQYRNAVVFLCPARAQISAMVEAGRKWLALGQLVGNPEQLSGLTDQQRAKLQDLHGEQELVFRIAICNAYSILYVPREGELDLLELATVTRATVTNNHTDNVMKALDSADKLLTSASQPPDPQYVRQKVWPHEAKSITTNDLVEAYASKPAMKIVLDQAKLIETIGAGVKAAVWEYHDSVSDAWWAKDDVPTHVRIAADTELFVPGSKPQAILPPIDVQQPCPFCGKPVHTGPCETTGRVRVFTQSGPAKMALIGARQAAIDEKVEVASEVSFRMTASAESMRAQLPRLLALGSGATAHLQLRLAGVASGSAVMSLEYTGEVTGYDGLKSAIQSYLQNASTGSLTASLRLPYQTGLRLASSEMDALIQRATDAGPDHVEVAITSQVEGVPA